MIRLGLIAVLLGAAAATVAPAADLVNDTYVLRAGDTIAVTVWNHPEFSMTGVQIRPDGKFMHPYAGEILAAGKTPGRLAGELRQALLKELRSPVVSVDIVEYREDRVFVVGAVKNPGSYLMREPFTVQQALASAGGATPTADMSSALLISPAGERTTVNLAAEMSVDPAAPRTPVTGGSTLILYERREERVAVLGAALAAAAWLFGPWAFMATTVGAVALLAWRQRRSPAATAVAGLHACDRFVDELHRGCPAVRPSLPRMDPGAAAAQVGSNQATQREKSTKGEKRLTSRRRGAVRPRRSLYRHHPDSDSWKCCGTCLCNHHGLQRENQHQH